MGVGRLQVNSSSLASPRSGEHIRYRSFHSRRVAAGHGLGFVQGSNGSIPSHQPAVGASPLQALSRAVLGPQPISRLIRS